jgi:hypothetical protein
MLNVKTGEMDAPQLQHISEIMDACTAPEVIHNKREFEAVPHRLLECACIFSRTSSKPSFEEDVSGENNGISGS